MNTLRRDIDKGEEIFLFRTLPWKEIPPEFQVPRPRPYRRNVGRKPEPKVKDVMLASHKGWWVGTDERTFISCIHAGVNGKTNENE
jgi:hypothetical protein